MYYPCIIVEDNILERDSLAMKVNKIDSLQLKATFSDGLSALNFIKKEEIAIVFSDIDMPHLSGLALLKSLKKPPVFIFTSSHPEHAAESFDLDVIDYIIKPVKMERLLKAVDKASIFLQTQQYPSPEVNNTANTSITSTLVRTIGVEDYFFIKENNSHIKINMGDVLYIESLGDFSKITLTSNKTHLVLVSLKNLEKQLPSNLFMRVHKQYIISLLHIKTIAALEIRLTNHMQIPLSPTYKQLLQENLVNKKSLTRFIE
jgi:two-component system, LytTR family, response regulator